MSRYTVDCILGKKSPCEGGCKGCGWDRKEAEWRKKMLKAGGLVQGKDGLRHMYMGKRGSEKRVDGATPSGPESTP